MQPQEAALQPHLKLVRLQAEAALVTRLNAGYGFADASLPSQVYLRDPEARERLGRDPLRPQDTHLEQAAEIAEAIADLEVVLQNHRSPLATLSQGFGLDPAEAALLTIAIAYELDADTRNLCHLLAGSRRSALYIDVCQLLTPVLGDAATLLRLLHSTSPLRWNHLIELSEDDGRRPKLAATVGCNQRVLSWLLGDGRIAAPLHTILTTYAADSRSAVYIPKEISVEIDRVAKLLRSQMGHGEPTAAVLIQGPQGSGKLAIARRLAAALNRPLARASLPRLLEVGGGQANQLIREALTEARLRGAFPYLTTVESLTKAEPSADVAGAVDVLDRCPGIIILSTRELGMPSLPVTRPFHLIQLPRPDLTTRQEAWREGLAGIEKLSEVGADQAGSLAARFVVGPGTIDEVLHEARDFAQATGNLIRRSDIEEAIGRRLTLRLGVFGSLITRRASFDEMVLPEDVFETLHHMIAMVRQRATILEEWGYAKHLGISRGVSALFSGEPGTGKTMAASVISSELGLELVRIDLSAVVSKWVGETEKHLAKIFDEAQHANAMLVFDEADSLFGKRTEIKSAQDRFANLEVNYVLQRMETFDGICILTSNLEASIDQAFLRRLNFRVRFPKPDIDERVELWRKLLPPEAETSGEVDFRSLAERFDMTGGHIRNSIMRAAVNAASQGRRMTARDLLVGAHLEYIEIGKVMPSLGEL